MNKRFFSTLYRLIRLTVPLCLVISTLAVSQVEGQEYSEANPFGVNYSYITEAGDKERFDLEELSKQLVDQRLDLESLNNLTARTVDDLDALASDPMIRNLLGNSTTRPLGQGILLGGMSSAAAIVILNVTVIGAEKCDTLGKVLFGSAVLGSSSMRAVQNAHDAATGIGLGRGEFDIRTTKFVLCRDPENNTFEGVPINVRWVFNVNGNSLTTEKAPFTNPPPNNGNYKQRFLARGLGIELVLMEIDGAALPPSNPSYLIVEDACIDIWFVDEVDDFDIVVPASMSGSGVFCAGGYCKGNPPGLDATQ
ncbi:hypothetical protein [uncultured Roseobacter sp.]|uniref:hypothetical protein n=1 Tax=uncultured Roseobacter sp. TaxID=114847 RepID=UPI0026085FE2|nr:hypothetical protein [uncultured Roseobacter sp.]